MSKDDFTVLPDGSGFFTASMPLPKDHWLYAPSSRWDSKRDELEELPLPILTRELEGHVRVAIRYAIRTATMNGTEPDFDPDALVQSAIYALCGPTSPPAREARA